MIFFPEDRVYEKYKSKIYMRLHKFYFNFNFKQSQIFQIENSNLEETVSILSIWFNEYFGIQIALVFISETVF